ncbi:MAG TPA: PP2C family protein-serine/threonine phosphatase, partial [Bacteroidales bacterium]|nr:PP2C family protein-serine/threonine phosphatase [Bacteroidales bacterium]
HGVPGAFMSMLGVAFLNEIINQNRILDPGKILYQLRNNLIDALHQTVRKRGSRDGMDMSLAIIDTHTHELHFSGAYNPMYIVRDNQLIDLKANRMPIGVHAVYQDKPFTVQKEKLHKNDKLYFFSDGFTDQFGGEHGNKLGRKKFKEILLNFNNHPMEEQKEALTKKLDDWMNTWSQIDDIMVLGFRFLGEEHGFSSN